MDNNKNYIDKLASLFEALSEISDHDIEDAKAVIRAAGKDPDAILKKGLENLSRIRQKTSHNSSNLSCKVVVLNEETQTVELTNTIHENRVLTMDEITDYLPQNKNKLYKTGESVTKIKIRQFPSGLHFTIHFGYMEATVSVFVSTGSDKILVDNELLAILIVTGYFISNNILYPLDKDALLSGKEFLSEINETGTISLKTAFKYFSQRSSNPWILFEPEEFHFNQIAKPDQYTGETSLFIRALYPYQKEGLQWLLYCCINRIGGILGDDMGLGKTAQAIALIAWIIEKNIFDNILIVVPSTLIENWKREFLFFAPAIIPYVHHGNTRAGDIRHLSREKVIITSYSMMVNDQFVFDRITWGLILMDEASLVKNPLSERRRAIAAIPAHVKFTMTGTPVENSLMDLWSLADLVYPGYLDTKENFAARYVQRDIAATLKKNNLEALRKTISIIMLRRKKEDVLDSLPERIDIHQALTQNDQEALIYEDKRQSLLSQYNSIPPDTNIHIFKLIQDMRQFTTHPFMKEPGTLASASIDELRNQSIKFSRTVELLEEIYERREKVLVFTEYLHMIDAMERVFSRQFKCSVYTIDGRIPTEQRQRKIDLFSATEGFSIMVLNPRTAGMGLNITAASHVIHYTRQWNPALEEQATARAYRNKQTKAVNIYYLYYVDTIEEIIDNRLREKNQLFKEVISETESGNDMEFYLNALSKSPLKK